MRRWVHGKSHWSGHALPAILGPFLALWAPAPTVAGVGLMGPPPLLLNLSPFLVQPARSFALSAGQDASSGVPAPAEVTPKLTDKISLSGFLAGEGRWKTTQEMPAAVTSTDLYLRAFELGIEVDVVDWMSATVVLNSEYIGDALNGGDSGVVVDEAHLDISVPHTPVYFVLGKRIQPFGLFETYLVTDLLVQDAYETKAVGLTAGINAPRSTDLSITLYKGRIRSDHLADSDLLGPDVPDLPEMNIARADSWILSGSSYPLRDDDWRVSAALASEPGSVRRMTTLNLGSYVSFPWHENLTFNAEYMRALRRDDVPGLGRSFRETALSVTASYQLVTREMEEPSGRNYRARRARRLAHPTVVVVRFEALDDGSRAAVLGTWSVRNRISAGGRYTFFEKGGVEAALGLEYRWQTLRISPAYVGPAGPSHEVYMRFGLDF